MEIISGWLLLVFLFITYLGVYLFFTGTLTRVLKESHVELTAAFSKVQRKLNDKPQPTKFGAAKVDDDAITA